MKVLLTGDYLFPNYEESFARALRSAGAEVVDLPLLPFFGPIDAISRAQRKYVFGPGRWAANIAFVAACRFSKPDLVLIWRSPYLYPWAVKAARSAGARCIVLYNNDDPFGPDRQFAIWRQFRRLIPVVDGCVAVRDINQRDYLAAGCRDVFLMRFFFDPLLHRPPVLTPLDRENYECDAVFIGHCEPDQRLEWMDQLLGSGLQIRLFGTDWERHASGRRWSAMLPIRPLWGQSYVTAIAAARTAIVFLSTRNRDQYTIRNFEIPAIGTLMVSQRTIELQSMYCEGKEALFFSNGTQLIEQIRLAKSDPVLRQGIAANGRARCLHDGHDSISSAKALLRHFG